jgi:hypothetical protein
MTSVFTQRYQTIKTSKGFQFLFFCDLCDYSVKTPEFTGASFSDALSQAQAYAKQYLNMCHTCSKWICDEHYNEDEMNCIICTPKQNRLRPHVSIMTQKKCQQCGHWNENGDCFCQNCGNKL